MYIDITRRNFLAAAGLITTAMSFGGFRAPASAVVADSDSLILEADGIRLFLGSDGFLHVQDAAGIDRLRIQQAYISGTLKGKITSATATKVNGKDALTLEFTIVTTRDDDVTAYGCTAVATVADGGFFNVVFDITTPDSFTLGSYTQVVRRFIPEGATSNTTSLAIKSWETDARGGIPFQTTAGMVYTTPLDNEVVCHELVVKNNPTWVNTSSFHLPSEKIDDTHYRMSYTGVVGSATAETAGALVVTNTLSVGAVTDQPFNLWLAEEASPTVTLTVTNKAAAADVAVSWLVRDFDGDIVAKGNQALSGLSGIGVLEAEISDKLPRGLYFFEAQARLEDEQAITRINLSVLPEWSNPVDAATSKFGLAAAFMAATANGVNRTDWLNLIQRLGIRHLRATKTITPEEAAQAGIVRNEHATGMMPSQYRGDATYPEGEIDAVQRRTEFETWIDQSVAAGSPYLEPANEWNMKGGLLAAANAEEYAVDYILPFKEYMDERGDVTTKLCTLGLAGPDYVWLEKFAAAQAGAGWRATDAVALHTGRGNFTPDFAPDPENWGTGSDGSYWNNEAGVLKILATIAKLDEQYGTHHELLITETYAVTYENHWWTDSYRNAAENTLLTIALAYRDNIHSFYWYQLCNGVYNDVNGVNPAEKEYSYGLMMSDGSLKPSAVAFATAAEHLGDASFVTEYQPGHESVAGHAMVFDTSRGQVHVLWSRADGYVLQSDHEHLEDGFYPSREPWVDEWPTKSKVTLEAMGEVIEIDCLGREKFLPQHDGKVTITLDGAPRLYYGLCVPSEEPSPELPPAWDGKSTYTAGACVTSEGAVWEALWWTRGEKPGTTTWGAWQEIAQTSDGIAIWTPTRIFTVGDVVDHDGTRFVAQWWTRNQVPTGAAGDAWKRK